MSVVAYLVPHPRYGATMGKIKHIVEPRFLGRVLTDEAALCGKRGKLGWVTLNRRESSPLVAQPTCPKCIKIEARNGLTARGCGT
jgi:hypothetical protein